MGEKVLPEEIGGWPQNPVKAFIAGVDGAIMNCA
jgi:hypothetical protein